MLRYALHDYWPKRLLRRASFEQLETRRRILAFKDGRRNASAWAAREVAQALAAINLHETVIACCPASCQRTTCRRYRRFSAELCRLCGAADGFSHIEVTGKREKVHICRQTRTAEGRAENVSIDASFFQGRKVIVFDDICTTGKTADAFIELLEKAGAEVKMAVFLAKTKRFKPYYN